MRYFLLPEEFTEKKPLKLTGRDFNYLARVLRFKKSDEFTAIDRSGSLFRIKVVEIDKKQITIKALGKIEDDTENPSPIYLYQCLPKGKKMDTIVRQSVEMGVAEIVPVISRFSVPILSSREERTKRQKRWNRIAKEAVQQSGNRKPISIREPVTFDNLMMNLRFIAEDTSKQLIIFHPETENSNTLHGVLSRPVFELHILIGPEGGFADEEVAKAVETGATLVSLGENILRSETAAIYAIASIKTILREKDFWTYIDKNERISI